LRARGFHFFGDREAAGYEVLTNRLLFPDSIMDPFLLASHYALFGSFDRDPDLIHKVAVIAKGFLRDLGLASGELEAEALLNVPENAKILMFTGLEDASREARRSGRSRVPGWRRWKKPE